MKYIIIALLAIVTLAITPSIKAQEAIVFLDANDLLRIASGIPTEVISTHMCSNKNGCTSYCAAKPQCEITRELRDIRIVSVDDISYITPDINAVPYISVDQNLTFDNCLSSDWEWKELLKHTLVRTVSSQIRTGFKDVQNRTISLSLDAKLFDSIGIKIGDAISGETSIETSTSVTTEQSESIYIEKPLAVTVPAKTSVTITYTDLQKRIRIPVNIVAVLDADIYYVETISTVFGEYDPPGTIWYERSEGALSVNSNVSQRTINAAAVINALGGSRDLKISLAENPLACVRSADTSRSEEFITLSRSVGRSCAANANVSQLSQSGDDLSAVFNVEVTDGCKKHSGEVEFTAVIEKLNASEESTGIFETRDGYAYWSNEDETDFAFSLQESGFFYENERLVELTDIDVNDCTCIIDKDSK